MFHFLKLTNSHHRSALELEALRIARFHALMKAKQVGNILLIFYIIVTSLLSIRSYPPLYILAVHNIFPLFIQHILSSRQKEKPLLLPLFAKKYKYSNVKYHSNAMSFLCTCFFLFLWQQSELRDFAYEMSQHATSLDMNVSIRMLIPTLILSVIVMYRFVSLLYYRKKFDYILTYGSNEII